jgi:hypothetical protein
MRRDFDSFEETVNFLAQHLVHEYIRWALEALYPDRSDRRIPAQPMSRSQFIRHRRNLRRHHPEKLDEAVTTAEEHWLTTAQEMGYLQEGLGSLANPDPRNIPRFDGTFLKALFDAVLDDLVVNPVTGEVQQARYDPDAVLGYDDDHEINPGYRWVTSHVAHPDPEWENCHIILGFERVRRGSGEGAAMEAILGRLRRRTNAPRHYLVDMIALGALINRLYSLGYHPIVKVPRGPGGIARSALIEVKAIKGHSGRTHTVKIYAIDGAAAIETVADGEDQLAVLLIPRAYRERNDHSVRGEYEIPDDPTVHSDLRNVRFQIRLDGENVHGTFRAQTLRWINEHTPAGRALLPQRNTTEGVVHSKLERTLVWKGRCYSVGEFNNTLDLLGYYSVENLRSQLHFERRRGSPVGALTPRPELPRLEASAAA